MSHVPGVDIEVPYFGENAHIWGLNNTRTNTEITDFSANLSEILVRLGCQKGHSVRGAPYDFRLNPRKN